MNRMKTDIPHYATAWSYPQDNEMFDQQNVLMHNELQPRKHLVMQLIYLFTS